jgi:hypothetical protein
MAEPSDACVPFRQLPYGFLFGSTTVARLYADRKGVGLEVTTSRDRVHIDVTPAGIISVRHARRRRSRLDEAMRPTHPIYQVTRRAGGD